MPAEARNRVQQGRISVGVRQPARRALPRRLFSSRYRPAPRAFGRAGSVPTPRSERLNKHGQFCRPADLHTGKSEYRGPGHAARAVCVTRARFRREASLRRRPCTFVPQRPPGRGPAPVHSATGLPSARARPRDLMLTNVTLRACGSGVCPLWKSDAPKPVLRAAALRQGPKDARFTDAQRVFHSRAYSNDAADTVSAVFLSPT